MAAKADDERNLGGHGAATQTRGAARAMWRLLARTAAFLAECLIRGYQVALSPLLIGGCKFCPSCSEYCIQAVREWGVIRGCWIGARRLIRCHPFSPGGIDPIPRRSAPK